MDDFQIFKDTLVKYHGKESDICIPEGVTEIGESAFKDCQSLVSVKIPDTVTTIGSNAFYGCSHLQSVDIPESVMNIGNYIFNKCDRLKHVRLPDSLETFGFCPFSDKTSLESYPDGFVIHHHTLIQYIGNAKTVRIPEGVTLIWHLAFHVVEHLIFPDSLENASLNTVYHRRYMKSITYHHIQILLDDDDWTQYWESIQQIDLFLQHPDSEEYQAYLKKHLQKIVTLLDAGTFRKILNTGKFFNAQEIDHYIRYMIDHQLYEKQIILMDYKAEHIGYDTIENTIKKKFDL